MRRYHWTFVLARVFIAIVVGLVWALRNYTDSWDHTKRCDPTWQGFLTYFALIVGAVTLIEILRWAIWFLRGVFQNSRDDLQVDEESNATVSFNTTDSKIGLLNCGIGLILLIISSLVGGPTPCLSLHSALWSWAFFLGCIVCGLGVLTIANGVVRES